MSVKTVNLGSEVLSSSGISKFYIFWIELNLPHTKDVGHSYTTFA